MNPSRNPSALRSKKVIMETFLSIMKQFPYQEITVKQIILETDISRKTFYRNFTSKEDVLISCLDMALQQYLDAVEKQDIYSLIPMLDCIFTFCEKNRELLFLLRDNELLHLLMMRLNRMIPKQHQKVMRYERKADEPCDELQQSRYIIAFNIGGIWNLIVRWIESDMQDGSEQIKNIVADYLNNIRNIDLRDI